ncbi:hypothetical protein [Vibrio parahaemolyticus]|uniref:hypothetical protein n=1 Tax=Vibrio parahaemolyticus TaxID=670 RepID=UPI001F4EE7A0|nr:hypothetical protein [Vibrio parahaemolyticus]
MNLKDISSHASAIRSVLDNFDKEFIESSAHQIKVTLFTNMCGKDFTIQDKQTLQQLIEKQVSNKISERENPLLSADTLDDVISNLMEMRSVENKRDLFLNKLYLSKVKKLTEALQESKSLERELLYNFLREYDFRFNGAIKAVEFEDFTLEDKTEYSVRSENGYENIYGAVFNAQVKHDTVRVLDDHISIDFEDYGYFINSELNQEFTREMVAAYNASLNIKNELIKVQDENKDYEDISKVLSQFADDLESLFPKDVVMPLLQNAEMVSDLCEKHMYQHGDDWRKEIISELQSTLSDNVVCRNCTIEFIQTVFENSSTLSGHIDFMRQARNNRIKSIDIDFDALSEEFDSNVNEAVSYHNENNQFMFKQKLNSLNPFERAAVTLTINADKEPEKQKTSDNVVPFR